MSATPEMTTDSCHNLPVVPDLVARRFMEKVENGQCAWAEIRYT
jgi:hypothetical protein